MRGAATAQGRKSGVLALMFILLAVLPALAATTFPALSGRVVDDAHILPAATAAAITTKLADLETKSGIQLVVATVPSLQGEEIEPFANELFRTWQLGEKTKNNGVLLLVAPNEHRVRIEVGYGLEGTLTDALSSVVIANAITPRFKANDFGGGIERGVDDIITILTTDSADWQPRPQVRLDNQDTMPAWSGYVFLAVLLGIIVMSIVSGGFRTILFQILLSLFLNSGRGGGYSGGGGFSGGGGASGGW